MNTPKSSGVLRTLIRACIDDERTLEHERRFVDEGRAETLTRMAREREQFVADLERLEGRARTRPNGTWREILREAGRSVWAAASGPNVGDAIASCRHSRARTEALYDKALLTSWPGAMGRVLEAQRYRLHEEGAELNRMQL